MMTLSFCGTISLLLLSVSSMHSDESVPDFNEISERIKKHNLHPRRALWGIDSCPSDFYQHGNSCCKTGTTLCCRMDGEGCYCRVGQILRQGNRGEPDGCGSALTGFGDIQQATFSEPGMKEACNQHDWCYTDCSKTHKQCDDEWYNAADQVCWDLYWNPLTSAVAAWDWLFGLNAGKGQCHVKVKAAYDYMSSYSAWMSSIGNSCSCDDSGKTYESVYKGCFKDDSARDFKVFIGRMGLSSPKRTCMDRCINYKYFSLQDGGNSKGPECFCSNDIKSNPGRYPQVADKECEVDRLGGGTLYGGAWRNAVYEITYGVNGEQYCESDDMMNNEVACKSSSCCHWNTWEEGEASNYGKGRCWSSIGQDICSDKTVTKSAKFVQVFGEGTCETLGNYKTITDSETCEAAARFLNKQDTTVNVHTRHGAAGNRPFGCTYHHFQNLELWTESTGVCNSIPCLCEADIGA